SGAAAIRDRRFIYPSQTFAQTCHAVPSSANGKRGNAVRDGQGLEVSNAGTAAIEALDFLTAEWMAFGDRLPDFVAVADREQRCALLPVLAANLLLSVNSSDARTLAQRYFERAKTLAGDLNARERAWLAATDAWFAGQRDRAQEIHEQMASDWPRDLLAAR